MELNGIELVCNLLFINNINFLLDIKNSFIPMSKETIFEKDPFI